MSQAIERTCNICGVAKPLDKGYFHFHSRFSRFVNQCKDCTNARSKAKRARAHTKRRCTWCKKEKPKDAFPEQTGTQICLVCRENPPKERVCSRCGAEKSTEGFEKGRGRNQCKECRKELHQERINKRADSEWECTQCNHVKSADSFHSGRRECKDCVGEGRRARRRNDSDWAELDRKRSKIYYILNHEGVREYGKRRWAGTLRPCKLCGKEKTPSEFIRNRQICLDCSNSPVRKCTSCGEDKPARDFRANRHSFSCRDCRNAEAQRGRIKNPERVKKARQKHRSKPGYRQKENERKKFLYRNNCSYAAQERERASRRRAQKAESLIEEIPLDHKETLIKSQQDRCAYCGKKFGNTTLNRPHLDHYNLLAKGGQHSTDNLKLVLCAQCNVRKGDKDPQEFVQQELGQLFDLATIPKTSPVHARKRGKRLGRRSAPSPQRTGRSNCS